MTEDITPIAHLIGVGPFRATADGQDWFHEQAFLYELYPPLEDSGESLVHIVVSSIEGDEDYGDEVVAFKTNAEGKLDIEWYAEYGAVLSLYGTINPEKVLSRLGYDLVAIGPGVLN